MTTRKSVTYTSYKVISGVRSIISGIALLCAGGFVTSFSVFAVIGTLDQPNLTPIAVGSLLSGVVIFIAGWQRTCSFPHQIVVGDDGTVLFEMVLSDKMLHVDEIDAIERTRSVLREDAKMDPGNVRIYHHTGTLRCPDFLDADRFMTHVRALNARVVTSWL